jgi:5-formyltetrahydrofolate cyclo-ligase
MPPVPLYTDKFSLRAHLLHNRITRDEGTQGQHTLTEQVLTLPELARLTAGATVAVTLPLPGEPDATPIADLLVARGVRLGYPRLRADNGLDFAPLTAGWRPGRRGTTEPVGNALIPIEAIDLFIVPGLAADPAGHRLGRGGGSFDRALAARRPDSLAVLLLWDDEVLASVPVDPHDQPVDVVATERRVLRCKPGQPGTASALNR